MTIVLQFLLCVAPVQSQDDLKSLLQSYSQPPPRTGSGGASTSRLGRPQPMQGAYGTSGFGISSRSRGLLPAQRRGQVAPGSTYVKPGADAATGAGARALNELAADFGLGAIERGLGPKVGGTAAGGTGATAAKWDLATLASAPGIPSVLLQGISGGPLTEQEAQKLADLLTGVRSGTPTGTAAAGPAFGERLFGSKGPDPDLQTLQRDLDALLPAPAPAPAEGSDKPSAPAIDGDSLRTWFQALDVSRDAALSFLEWRDRTGLPLSLFRAIDDSGEGLIAFDEFARALIINGALAGNREIDPKLLDWAMDKPPESPTSDLAGDVAAVAALTNEEAKALARAELAAAALLLPATAPDAQPATGAKGGAKAAKPKTAPAAPPPAPKPGDAAAPRPKDGGR